MVAKFFSLSFYNKKRKCMSWISLQLKKPLESMVGYFRTRSFSELPFEKKYCPALNVSNSKPSSPQFFGYFISFFFFLEQPHSYGLRSDNAINMHRHVARTRPQTCRISRTSPSNPRAEKWRRTLYNRKLYDCVNYT